MQGFIEKLGNFLGEVIGGGPASGVLITIALLGMAFAVVTIIMELAGYTITLRGIRKNNMRWGSTAIATAAIVAAFYIAGALLQIAPIVPGFATWTPIRALPPDLASLFGLPGVVGVTFAMPIGDALSGKLTLGSIAGMLSHWTAVTYIPYKMVSDASLRNGKSWGQFYLWGVLIGGFLHSIIIPGWLDFLNLLPPAVAWGAVTPAVWLNHIIGAAVLGGPILYVIYPRVKALGLYWRDRYMPADQPREAQAAKPA